MTMTLMTTFGGFDFIILLSMALGLWRGFRLGLVKTVIGLLGWLFALIAGSRMAFEFAPLMSKMVAEPNLQLGLAFLVIVLMVLTLVHVAGYLITHAIHSLRLGLLDKMLGGAVGGAKNLLIVLVVLNVTAPLLQYLPWWSTSKLTQSLMPYAPIATVLTQQMAGKTYDYLTENNSRQDLSDVN